MAVAAEFMSTVGTNIVMEILFFSIAIKKMDFASYFSEVALYTMYVQRKRRMERVVQLHGKTLKTRSP